MPETHSEESAIRILGAARAWILDRSIGLYRRMRGGNPVLEGSGVLLQIADSGFVVSAGHVLEAAKEAEILLGPMVDGARLIRAAAAIKLSQDRVLDVGFIRLPETGFHSLTEYNKRFVRLSDLDLTHAPSVGFYSVVGFPLITNSADHNSKLINATPFCYGTYLYKGEVDHVTPSSIVLGWDTDTVRAFPCGEEQRMPYLQGISGCGIWRLYGEGDRLGRLESWDVSWIRLAAFEHTVSPKKWIKGTLVHRVIELIAREYPDLRASIRLSVDQGMVVRV